MAATPGEEFEAFVREVRPRNKGTRLTPLPALGSLHWSEDGRQLFYASYSYGKQTTTLGRYDVTTETWELVEIDAGDSVAFVPIERDRAEALLAGERVEPDECPSAGGVFPSGRTRSCTFVVQTRLPDPNAGEP